MRRKPDFLKIYTITTVIVLTAMVILAAAGTAYFSYLVVHNMRAW